MHGAKRICSSLYALTFAETVLTLPPFSTLNVSNNQEYYTNDTALKSSILVFPLQQ